MGRGENRFPASKRERLPNSNLNISEHARSMFCMLFCTQAHESHQITSIGQAGGSNTHI